MNLSISATTQIQNKPYKDQRTTDLPLSETDDVNDAVVLLEVEPDSVPDNFQEYEVKVTDECVSQKYVPKRT